MDIASTDVIQILNLCFVLTPPNEVLQAIAVRLECGIANFVLSLLLIQSVLPERRFVNCAESWTNRANAGVVTE